MKIELIKIKISEIFEGYVNNDELGVRGYGGKLNIRPKYQREFVYNDKQENAVIETIINDFPLNVMYWSKNSDGTYEIIDGQQRTLSFLRYMDGKFAFKQDAAKYFHSLTNEEQEQINNYELFIYICEGTEKEKLDWFKVINIAGEKLTNQELRNAIYTGPWLTDAKKYFSGKLPPMAQLASKYYKAIPLRQELLELAINWKLYDEEVKKGKKIKIDEYMSKNKNNSDASELRNYFEEIIEWVKKTFIKYRNEMKKVNWGKLYANYGGNEYDSNEIEETIGKLMLDNEIQKREGIYSYYFTRDASELELRKFPNNIKSLIYENQKGICRNCKKQFKIEDMEADHIKPWSKGGKTIESNCQLLCKSCNARKSNNY